MIALAVQIALVAALALALAHGPLRRRPALRHATLVCALLVVAAAPLWRRVASRVSWRRAAVPAISDRAPTDLPPHLDLPLLSSPSSSASPRHRHVPWQQTVAVAWILGTAAMLVRIVHGLHAAHRLLRRARPAATIDGCPLRVCDDVAGPVSVGIFRPQVLVPTMLMQSLAPGQLRQVVAHERAHARRGDHLVALLQRLVAAAWWPHPLVHLLNRALDRAREERCDNDVILAGHDRFEYARTLLHVADSAWWRVRPSLTFALTFMNRTTLERRIAGLVDERRNLMSRAPLPLIVIVLTAFAGGAVLLSCATGVTRAAADDGKTFVLSNMPATQPSLPLHEIKFELGETEFEPGDSITIEQVLCTGERLGIGEIAIVRGRYTLASHDVADLAFHVTANSPNPTPVDPRQRITAKRGSGTFELRHALWDGYPHVSFYEGGCFGGVYFGIGDSVLKKKGWSYKTAPTTAAAGSVGGAPATAKR